MTETKSEEKKYGIFDLLNDLTQKKDNEWTEEVEKVYNPWMINKGLSQQSDCVMFANEMNLHHRLPKKAQFEYYNQVLRKYRRKGAKWPKPDDDADILMIMEIYNYSRQRAKETIKVLTPDQIKTLREQSNKGG